MPRRADPSRPNIERILDEGIQDGSDSRALREYLVSSERGRGNTPFHRDTAIIIWRIRELLDTPAHTVGAIRERKLKELSAKRESGEISPYDLDLDFLFRVSKSNSPLTRQDLIHPTGNQAVVLYREDLETLGRLRFIHVSGETMTIRPESLKEEDVLILYPHELGDAPPKPAAASPAEYGPLRETAQAMLRTIFADVTHVTVAEHPTWANILKKVGTSPATAIMNGRKENVPESYIRAFAFHECLTKVDNADFGFVARFLKNMKLASDEAVAAFEMLATQAAVAKAAHV
jgi:hypothetical protein